MSENKITLTVSANSMNSISMDEKNELSSNILLQFLN